MDQTTVCKIYHLIYRFIVTVMLLLWTNKDGGRPCHSTSRSLKYDAQFCSLCDVPCTGDGRVVNSTAVALLCWTINSFKIKCCARLGRSLNDSGTEAGPGKPDAVWLVWALGEVGDPADWRRA